MSLSLLPGAAQAHLVSSGLGPFYDGALHLLLSPLDLLALLAVVLLAGQGGKASARRTVVALPVAWGMAWVGGVLIGERVFVADFDLDWIKIVLLTAVGVAVAAGLRGSAPVLATLAVAVGIVCGLAGGLAAADAGDPATAFAGLAVTVLILALLVSALAVSLQRDWTRIVLRVAGSWIAAIGLLAAGWLLQGVG